MARPMPREEPVTIATRPVRSNRLLKVSSDESLTGLRLHAPPKARSRPGAAPRDAALRGGPGGSARRQKARKAQAGKAHTEHGPGWRLRDCAQRVDGEICRQKVAGRGRVDLVPKQKLVLVGRVLCAKLAYVRIGETAGPARIVHIREAKVGWVGFDLVEQIV